MDEKTSLILFCVFMAAFLGLIIYNIILVKQPVRRVALFLGTVVLPFLPFLMYYLYKATGVKGSPDIPQDLELVLLRMDILTFYLVVVFLLQAALLLYFSFRKWKQGRPLRPGKV